MSPDLHTLSASIRARALHPAWYRRREPERCESEAYLWDCCYDDEDRLFVCRIMGADGGLAALLWADLDAGDRDAISGVLVRLNLWISKHAYALREAP